jgi:uncharacterized membrane protein
VAWVACSASARQTLVMAELEVKSRSSSVERTIMLTDAVVAIAMTLLVLPLVDAVPDVDLDDVGAFVGQHLSQFISFVVSFLVILLFWSAHQRLFNGLWLFTVAFLPFPTALVGRGPTTSTTPIYIGTVFVLAVTSTVMSYTVSRGVVNPAARAYLGRRTVVALGSCAVLLACSLIATRSPDIALYGLFGIALVRVVGDRWAERRDPASVPT